MCHLLQADDIRILRLDAVDDPHKQVPPVATTDPPVDVPTQQSLEKTKADRSQPFCFCRM